MTDLNLAFSGSTITAASKETRTIRGQIVPYDVYGSTSAGLVKIRPGALDLPDDPKQLLLRDEHSPMGSDVGVGIELQDSATALAGAFRVARRPEGDQLLADADPECPLKGGLSVELSHVVFAADEPDTVVSARLNRVAAVGVPAFRTSRIASVAASHHPQEGTAPVTLPIAPAAAPAAPAAPAPAAPAAPAQFDLMASLQALAAMQAGQTTPAAPSVPNVPGTTVPDLAAAFHLPGTPVGFGQALTPAAPAAAPAAPEALKLDRVTEVLAAFGGSMGGNLSAELTAALSDITYSGQTATRQAEWLGELWSGPGYVRRFVPLCTPRPLKAMRGVGWRWVERPEVDDYAGDKAEVPSNDVTTAPAEWTASRVAGAWDVDRAYIDFGDTEFYRSFLAATTDSYRQKTDAKTLAFIIANAVDATTLAAGGYPYATTAPDVLTAVATLSALMGDLPTVSQAADYVLMNTATLLGLMDVTGLDLSAFLNLLGVDPGKFRWSNRVPVNRVIAGTTTAVEYRELGDVPIRVDALDIARGGIDTGVFGYCSHFLARQNGVLSLAIDPAAAVG